MFRIIFGIHCNFFIVLHIRKKIWKSNCFHLHSKMCKPENCAPDVRPISISRTICPNLMLEKWKPALIVRDHLVHYSLICQWHMIVSHVIWSTHRSVFFSPFLIFFMCFIPCYKQCTLPKIPQFYLIYWCGNFVP